MATRPPTEDILVQMATRVPASLLRAIKVHCVERGVTVMRFVEDALREKLKRRD